MITITAAVVTLGCRLNQADSALLNDRLTKAGFQIIEEDGEGHSAKLGKTYSKG